MADDDIQAVEKALGDPVLEELSEDTRRTRRNLLIVAGVAIFYRVNELQISEAGFLGIKFSTVPISGINVSLTLILLYFVIQFGWQALDHFRFMRIRITGSRIAHVTTGQYASSHADYPSDPRQSSLYRWWLEQAQKIGSIQEPVEKLGAVTSSLKAQIESPEFSETPNYSSFVSSTIELTANINKLDRSIDNSVKTLTALRIPASLERFDRWFWQFQRSQILRLLILELGFPILLGLVGLALFLPLLKPMT